MEPLDFLTDEELLRFFRCSRTEMSCMEQPHTFLNQLRDHNLIPEEMYKKLIRCKSKEVREKGVYQVLDWVEAERPDSIKVFWNCVFRDHLLQQYPTLRLLRNHLLDGSFTFYEKLTKKVEKDEEEEDKKKASEEGEDGEEEEEKEEEEVKTRKNCKEKERSESAEEEQPSTSTQSNPSQKRKVQSPTNCFASRKGEKDDIWTWPIYKTQLPVTCGDKEGILIRNKLAKGERCIVVQGRWFTPSGFEEFGGKKSSKKWKYSIRCSGTTLGELIQEGHLTSPDFKRRKSAQDHHPGSSSTVRRSLQMNRTSALFPSNQSVGSITQSEEDDDEEDEVADEAEQEREEGEREEQANTAEGLSRKGGSHGAVKKSVFKVTCGDINGMLHKDRFASGSCGKSIRTELRWMTPVEFVKGESALEDPSWKKDIQWDGKPLSLLIESKILVIHSLLCKCKLCSSTTKDRDNDDDCFICRSQGSLICCDECPRSFHQRCHLPNVDDAILGDDRPWLCTFCVLRASQSWSYPTQMTYQEALTCRISDHPLECQYLLLCLYHADEDHIFVKDPCINVRNYTSVIKTPIWLDRVVEKLQQNLYQSVQHFVSDVLLIFTNCATFNRDNAEFCVMGERLKDLFEREFKSTFSIQLQHPTASNSQ
ncbi:nuclear body protein SP140-like protein isoform X1 [Oncorhynchus kisutch]|uniref:Nuclear body protein SP140-like protein n=1 Tax=Oncorhynchus kisutch TaxID=8019 RepID=A0A8C7DH86_ONCKI|nr:nuclear body protein SP140-like protein isoform X1 [Oncorhynchus kisutch]XP_031683023.1 nuclear body protein SP140-like protein isoform X1 [Oncorhynchus kisutch]